MPTNYAKRYIDIQKENLLSEDFLLRSKYLREEILSEIYRTDKPALNNSYTRDALMAFMSIFPFSLEQDGALIEIFITYYTKTFFDKDFLLERLHYYFSRKLKEQSL